MILVTKGRHVRAGQVLMRLDTTLSDADGKAINIDYHSKQITLRRIDAGLADQHEFKSTTEGTEEGLLLKEDCMFERNRLRYLSVIGRPTRKHDRSDGVEDQGDFGF